MIVDRLDNAPGDPFLALHNAFVDLGHFGGDLGTGDSSAIARHQVRRREDG